MHVPYRNPEAGQHNKRHLARVRRIVEISLIVVSVMMVAVNGWLFQQTNMGDWRFLWMLLVLIGWLGSLLYLGIVWYTRTLGYKMLGGDGEGN